MIKLGFTSPLYSLNVSALNLYPLKALNLAHPIMHEVCEKNIKLTALFSVATDFTEVSLGCQSNIFKFHRNYFEDSDKFTDRLRIFYGFLNRLLERLIRETINISATLLPNYSLICCIEYVKIGCPD